MNRIILFFAFVVLCHAGYSQEGDLFVSQYKPTFNQENQVYFDIKFTNADEMVAANRSGVVKFDGRDWYLIPTPSTALSVALDDDMGIYVACIDDFGMIGIVEGQYRFISLASATNRNLTKQVLENRDMVYFLQGYEVHVYDTKTKETSLLTVSGQSSEFTRLTAVDGKVYVETTEATYVIDGELKPTQRLLPDGSIILVSAEHEATNRRAYFGGDGDVFIFNKEFSNVEALSDKDITGLAWVSPQILAASTLSEGIYFYDIAKKAIIGQSTSRNGLTDNEIFAIAADRSAGLWVANSFGFNRIAPLLPIRSFNHYPGIEGNLTTAAYLDNTWYLATSFGVYHFEKEDQFKSVVYYVPKEGQKPRPVVRQAEPEEAAPDPEPQPTAQPTAQNDTQNTADKKEKSKLGKLFSKNKKEEDADNTVVIKPSGEQKQEPTKFNISGIFKKRDKENDEQTTTSRRNTPQVVTKIQHSDDLAQQIDYDRKVRTELVSTNYLYKKVKGLSEKCKQLIPFDNSVIAVTPSGLLEIVDNNATEIYQEPVRFAFHPRDSRALWVSSKTGRVIKIEEKKNVWRETQILETPGDVILSIYEDAKGTLWMVGANNLFEVNTKQPVAKIVNTYPIDNHFFDQIRITEINNKLYFFNTLGIFKLDEENDAVVPDYELLHEVGHPMRHLIQSDGRAWIHNGSNWIRIEKDGKTTQFNYLKLFPEMTFVEQIGNELWLIDNHRALYKFTPQQSDSIPTTKMFFRKIEDGGGIISRTSNMFKIDYERNSVHIEMSRPDYLGLLNIEYQYRLIGLQDEWSPWLSNNKLSFNYLPAGQYMLEVRSRDAFGRIQLSDPVFFRIDPPYWQTIWFNALQVLFFVGMVFIASRLNRKQNDSPRLLLLTNILTVVTIVMIIELLQNLAQSYVGDLGSPVMAFALDVFVALLIFPIEMTLKRVVTGGNEAAMRKLV